MSAENGNGRVKQEKNKGTLHPAFLTAQWKPGQSGNPKGRPRHKTFTELANEYLNAGVLKTEDGVVVTRLHLLAEAIIQKAVKGHNTAIVELLDRIDPAPKHSITINNNVPAPIVDSLRRIGIDTQEESGA